MKKMKISIVFIVLLSLIPISSYAIFDIGAYGSYTFASKESASDGPKGFGYGFIAHYNKVLIPIVVSFGIGAYGQFALLDSGDYKKYAVGLDLYLQSELPFLIHPYIKASTAIFEKAKGGSFKTDNNFFKNYSIGVGTAIMPAPIFQIFGEYVFNFGRLDSTKVRNHSINLGVRFNF